MNIDPAITSLLRYGSNHQSFALLFRCERSAVPEIEVIIGEEQHLNSLQSLADLSAIADSKRCLSRLIGKLLNEAMLLMTTVNLSLR
ncbi:TPA: hypothetical protein SMP03_002006 [Proteus mirabilis]|nr:hypothetical protein [Proteus mirabilis]